MEHAYCHWYGHDEDHCWRKQRETQACDDFHRRGHTEDDCWTAQRGQEHHHPPPGKVNILKESEKEDGANQFATVMAAVQSGCDGEPLLKKRNTRVKAPRVNAKKIGNLINRPVVSSAPTKAKQRKQRKKRKKKSPSGIQAFFGRVEQYDFVAVIAKANAGTSFDHLLRGDFKKSCIYREENIG